MCHASVQAFKDLWAFGTITSGATMVPCPWFPAVAQMCRENPQMDMGVHATLNAEWDNYRWGPVSTREQASGLMDADGYFHQWHQAVYDNARPKKSKRKSMRRSNVPWRQALMLPTSIRIWARSCIRCSFNLISRPRQAGCCQTCCRG